LVPVAVTVSVTRVPAATVVSAVGWVVIAGATTLLPELLDEEDELELEDEELLEDEEEDELELLEELEEDEELELLEELEEEPESWTTALLLVTEPAELETTTE
jgi:hypothetical protein